MNHPTHDFAETLGAFLPLLVVLRPREWEKVPAGRMRVVGKETSPVERAGVRAGFRLAHLHLPVHGEGER